MDEAQATDTPVKEMSAVVAVRTYFLEGVPATQVMQEWKALSPADKTELAEGAAKELGVTLKN